MIEPTADYIAGYRQAIKDASKCGAYNNEQPLVGFALCIRQAGHTGMHDDSWRLWGDREASAEANYRDAWTEP